MRTPVGSSLIYDEKKEPLQAEKNRYYDPYDVLPDEWKQSK